MKRILSLLLIAFIIANLAGFYLYFIFRIESIQQEMKAELLKTSPDNLIKISISRFNYNKAKKSEGEIEWLGNMYDVASLKFDGDRVEVLALRDELETELLSFFDALLTATGHDTKIPPKTLQQYLTLFFTIPESEPLSFNHPEIARTHFTSHQFQFSETCQKIPEPPPRG